MIIDWSNDQGYVYSPDGGLAFPLAAGGKKGQTYNESPPQIWILTPLIASTVSLLDRPSFAGVFIPSISDSFTGGEGGPQTYNESPLYSQSLVLSALESLVGIESATTSFSLISSTDGLLVAQESPRLVEILSPSILSILSARAESTVLAALQVELKDLFAGQEAPSILGLWVVEGQEVSVLLELPRIESVFTASEFDVATLYDAIDLKGILHPSVGTQLVGAEFPTQEFLLSLVPTTGAVFGEARSATVTLSLTAREFRSLFDKTSIIGTFSVSESGRAVLQDSRRVLVVFTPTETDIGSLQESLSQTVVFLPYLSDILDPLGLRLRSGGNNYLLASRPNLLATTNTKIDEVSVPSKTDGLVGERIVTVSTNNIIGTKDDKMIVVVATKVKPRPATPKRQ